MRAQPTNLPIGIIHLSSVKCTDTGQMQALGVLH